MSQETFVVEAVTSKFANKYNSGSVLTDGKWLQVSKKLDLNDFPKGAQVTVETKTNDKGYKSIVDLVNSATETFVIVPEVKAGDDKVLETKKLTQSYDEQKSRRILVQGIVQAVVQSPSLAGLPGTGTKEIIANTEEVSSHLINFVDEMCK